MFESTVKLISLFWVWLGQHKVVLLYYVLYLKCTSTVELHGPIKLKYFERDFLTEVSTTDNVQPAVL